MSTYTGIYKAMFDKGWREINGSWANPDEVNSINGGHTMTTGDKGTKQGFTPGPWIITDVTDMVQPKHERPLGPVFWIGQDDYQSIAEVRAGSTDDGLPKQTRANAALIATAPEMYAFLKRCQTDPDFEGMTAEAELHRIINKAEGGR